MKQKEKKMKLKKLLVGSAIAICSMLILVNFNFISNKETDKIKPMNKIALKREISKSAKQGSSSEEIQVANNTKEDAPIEDTIVEISKEDYIKYSKSQSEKFRDILKNYDIETISIEPQEDIIYLNETSIYQSDLGLPNGYKSILIDNDINQKVQLYISLTNSINQDNSWGEIINIMLIYKNTQKVEDIFTYNKEIEEVIKAFCNEEFDYEKFKEDISLLISTNEPHITKEEYSLSKEDIANNTNISIHINSNNGLIKTNSLTLSDR